MRRVQQLGEVGLVLVRNFLKVKLADQLRRNMNEYNKNVDLKFAVKGMFESIFVGMELRNLHNGTRKPSREAMEGN